MQQHGIEAAVSSKPTRPTAVRRAVGACLLLAVLSGAPLAAGPTLDEAVGAVSGSLVEALTTRPVSGAVEWVNGPTEVVVKLQSGEAALDRELLVRRAGRGGFVRNVALLRVAAVQGNLVRCVALWQSGELKPGDAVARPERFTVYLKVDESADSPAEAARLNDIADRLEQALVDNPALRVVRAEPAAPSADAPFEYAVVAVPKLATVQGQPQLVLTRRSLYTGQALGTASADLPLSASLVASGLPGRAPLALPVEQRRRGASYGEGIRPVEPGVRGRQAPERGLRVRLPHRVEAIALGDVDGDGAPELVGITKKQLLVYRWDGRRLRTIHTGEELPRFTSYLHVDAGDLNGNGRAEIVVTKIRSIENSSGPNNELESAVHEMSGSKLVQVGPPLRDRFARVLQRPNAPPVLLTQELGQSRPFQGAVSLHQWRSGRYVEVRNATVPRVPSLYGFAWSDLNGDRRADVVLVDEKGRVTVADDRGIALGSGPSAGPAATDLGFNQLPDAPSYDGLSRRRADARFISEWRRIPRRLLVVQGPEATEVITAGNDRSVFSLGDPSKFSGRGGHAIGYTWDRGQGKLAKRWQTDKLDVPARDVAVGDLLSDGRTELVLLTGSGKKRVLNVLVLYANRA